MMPTVIWPGIRSGRHRRDFRSILQYDFSRSGGEEFALPQGGRWGSGRQVRADHGPSRASLFLERQVLLTFVGISPYPTHARNGQELLKKIRWYTAKEENHLYA